MTQPVSYTNTKLDKAMSSEKFTQIEEAIHAGKYSWACVLILRFAGYNPLHYIPYRTYNRLLKENCQLGNSVRDKTDNINIDSQRSGSGFDDITSQKYLSKITALGCLKTINEQHPSVRDGHSN
ncbi:HetP family heterocyst commitment protein [Argonema antarcticum]|uniref:HetP family heterocyst commitment protein n=1 Tax=Argonema antarcticum TaxID=2942763 RepID=UPI00201221FB|nr:HetP family heterocyst commitment protein [Argonema antarcticum]MCL1474339.1 HetP family heterocyst commitment protein [Argonema antarcticum A004/B2]